jgi:hypothetical protein
MDIFTEGRTFEKLRETLKWGIADAGRVIDDPDGDWTPCLFVESADDVVVRDLSEYSADTDEDKDYLAEVVIPELIREQRGYRVGLSFPAWSVVGAAAQEELDRFGSLAAHPLRVEVVTLLVVDRERSEAWIAVVDRRGRRPRLFRWLQVPAVPTGRFVDPLRRAVCAQG